MSDVACTQDERKMLDALRASGTVRDNEYDGGLVLYRFRLFSREERRVILKSLPNGSAGMLDEIEMINYAVHGRKPEEVAAA